LFNFLNLYEVLKSNKKLLESTAFSRWSRPDKHFSCFCGDEPYGKGPLFLGEPYEAKKSLKKARATATVATGRNNFLPVRP
jgi:hypothetical protein